MIIFQETSEFIVSTDYVNKKVFVKFKPEGGAFIRHNQMRIEVLHRKTQDVMSFRVTGKGNIYQRPYGMPKEEQLDTEEFLAEMKRLGIEQTGILALLYLSES